MSFQSIREKIIEVINNQATLVQAAYPTDTSTFEGFPAVVVSPALNEADYGSTARDRRTYVFTVKAYYPIKSGSVQEEVEYRLEKVVDELLDIFKTRNVLGAAADWVIPVPGAWDTTTVTETPYRIATLTIQCVKMIANV